MGLFSIFKKEQKEDLNKGLEKTKQSIFSRITKAIAGKNTVDDDFWMNWKIFSFPVMWAWKQLLKS